ncbi:uncharacterized protein LOC120084708 [Benincasa hispida]|uniref:uncharacterized protein LOC120084708 n=1 Tax=Benincasa hispida TaxID=102211 RepID=UPI0019020358|nr:uncharacterized protein LOC120084708 [Benincasa hispida]
MSVAEYERKFDRLSHFVPRLVDTEEKKMERFIWGLREGIRGIVTAFRTKRKANIITDALSRKSAYTTTLSTISKHIMDDLERVEISLIPETFISRITQLIARPALRQRIIDAQQIDKYLNKQLQSEIGETSQFSIAPDSTLLYRGRLCVPDDEKIKKELLKKAHESCFSIHPGSTKMYQDLKAHYWWCNMKKDIADYIKTLVSSPSSGKVCRKQCTSSNVLKRSHPVTWSPSINCFRSRPSFRLQVLEKFAESNGTQLNFSTAFHPQTDGQIERVNQILEEMLRACALNFTGAWDSQIHLIEFAYKNSYQATIGMEHFEALYGKKCRSSIHWDEVGERTLLGPELV